MAESIQRQGGIRTVVDGLAALSFAAAISSATVGTAAAAPASRNGFETRQVCNAQGVCCTLTAQGQIADCLIAGSPGSPGNPGQYSDPYPSNVVTMPPSTGLPIDPAHSDAGPCVLFPNSPGCR
jgi:hypothetical protein